MTEYANGGPVTEERFRAAQDARAYKSGWDAGYHQRLKNGTIFTDLKDGYEQWLSDARKTLNGILKDMSEMPDDFEGTWIEERLQGLKYVLDGDY
jgi:hypothetical protein